MHVVSLALAALVQLVSLHEGAGQRVELLELKLARGLVVAERRRHGEVLRASVEDDVRRLRLGRPHIDRAHVHSVVAAGQRHLQRQVASVVIHSFSGLRHKLFLPHRVLTVGGDARVNTDGVRLLNLHLAGLSELHEADIRLLFHRAEALADVGVLHLAQLGEIRALQHLNVDLTFALALLKLLDLDMRNVVLL